MGTFGELSHGVPISTWLGRLHCCQGPKPSVSLSTTWLAFLHLKTIPSKAASWGGGGAVAEVAHIFCLLAVVGVG